MYIFFWSFQPSPTTVKMMALISLPPYSTVLQLSKATNSFHNLQNCARKNLKFTLLFTISATPRWTGPNNSKLGRCVDQCTTNNLITFPDRWRTHRPNSDISGVTSNVSVIPCSVRAELPHKVEKWKLLQVCLVDVKGRNIGMWVHSNEAEWLVSGKHVCPTVTLRLVQGMLLRQLCVYAISGEKRVVRRDEQVLDHSTGWPSSCPHGRDGPYSFTHSTV